MENAARPADAEFSGYLLRICLYFKPKLPLPYPSRCCLGRFGIQAKSAYRGVCNKRLLLSKSAASQRAGSRRFGGAPSRTLRGAPNQRPPWTAVTLGRRTARRCWLLNGTRPPAPTATEKKSLKNQCASSEHPMSRSLRHCRRPLVGKKKKMRCPASCCRCCCCCMLYVQVGRPLQTAL